LQLFAYSHSLGTSFELLTPTIDLRALLLRCSDPPIENALQGQKLGQNGKESLEFGPTESFLTFQTPTSCKISSNRVKIVTVGARTGRPTEGYKWFCNLSYTVL